jgi:hypothetical protein
VDAMDRCSCSAASRRRSLMSFDVRIVAISVFACGVTFFLKLSMCCDCTAFQGAGAGVPFYDPTKRASQD